MTLEMDLDFASPTMKALKKKGLSLIATDWSHKQRTVQAEYPISP